MKSKFQYFKSKKQKHRWNQQEKQHLEAVTAWYMVLNNPIDWIFHFVVSHFGIVCAQV